MRDSDVHFASTGAEPLPKYVEEDRNRDAGPYMISSAALFGSNSVVEMENPDGTKVKGRVLRGTVGLYIDQQGRRVEATTACREFISQLRSLLDTIKQSYARKSTEQKGDS